MDSTKPSAYLIPYLLPKSCLVTLAGPAVCIIRWYISSTVPPPLSQLPRLGSPAHSAEKSHTFLSSFDTFFAGEPIITKLAFPHTMTTGKRLQAANCVQSQFNSFSPLITASCAERKRQQPHQTNVRSTIELGLEIARLALTPTATVPLQARWQHSHKPPKCHFHTQSPAHLP